MCSLGFLQQSFLGGSSVSLRSLGLSEPKSGHSRTNEKISFLASLTCNPLSSWLVLVHGHGPPITDQVFSVDVAFSGCFR